jgi:hypothetical protein
MKTGIIQHDHLPRGEFGDKTLFYPAVDERRIAVALKGEWGQDRPVAPACHHADSLRAVPGLEVVKPFRTVTPSIGIGGRVVHPGFIDIHHLLNAIGLKRL